MQTFPPRQRAGLVLLLTCSACSAPRAKAEERERPRRDVAVTIENDFFTGSDNNYSNGFGLTWQSAEFREYEPDDFTRRWVDFWSFLPHIGDENCQVHSVWSVGQEIFTPDDITLAVPPADDQPYAGVLFLDSALYARSHRVTHAWNLRMGMVGPSAGGDEVQSGFHDLIGADEPKGWDAQLPHEPILNLDYSLGYEWFKRPLTESAELRVVPVVGASVGNYFTGLSTAIYGELGWNMPQSIGLLSIRRGLDPFVDSDAGEGDPWSFSMYLGAGGFAVGHYLPLDGTLLRDSASVQSEPTVGFVSTGLTLRLRKCTLGYLLTAFSDTFEDQRQGTEYGTLSISWRL